MSPRFGIAPGVALLAAFLGAAGSEAAGFDTRTAGRYVDVSGRAREWHVDAGRRLIWEGEPLVPVGGMFCFGHLSEHVPGDPAGNERRWVQDREILDRIVTAGIRDLYVNPVNAATRYPAAVWNRCLEELDRRGFRYGLELTDGPARGMTGVLTGGRGWKWTRESDWLRFRFSREFGEFPKFGGAWVVALSGRVEWMPSDWRAGEMAAVRLPAWASGEAVVGLPRIEAPRGFNVADIWEGLDEYERRLGALLRALRKGSGLRFVVDPLTNEMNFHDYTANLVPATAGFHRAFEQWLRRKYREDRSRLLEAWGMRAHPALSWEGAARLVPVPGGALTAAGAQAPGEARRAPFALDPKTLAVIRVERGRGGLLHDLREYRDRSAGEACARIARLVRETLGDVPVIAKHTGPLARYLVWSSDGGGLDGIGAESWGENRRELARTTLPALAVIRHWRRPGWFSVTETAPSPTPKGRSPGYPSRAAMFRHLDTLLDLGARGFYLFALRPLPEHLLPDYCLHRDPRQMAWIGEYAKALGEGTRAAKLMRSLPIRDVPCDGGDGLSLAGWPPGQRPPVPFSREVEGRLLLPRLGGK